MLTGMSWTRGGGHREGGPCMSLDHLPDLERDPVVEGECGVKGQRAGLKDATNCTFSHLAPQCSHLPNVNTLLFLRIIMQINLDNLLFFKKALETPLWSSEKHTGSSWAVWSLSNPELLWSSDSLFEKNKVSDCIILWIASSSRCVRLLFWSAEAQKRHTHI